MKKFVLALLFVNIFCLIVEAENEVNLDSSVTEWEFIDDTSIRASIHINRGYDYYSRKDYDNAVKEYRTAIQLDSNDAFIYAEAKQHLAEITKIHINNGFEYFNKKKYKEAIKEYNKAIQVDSNDASIYIKRGNAYYKNGDSTNNKVDYDKAIIDYEFALQIDSNNVEVKQFLATAHNSRGYGYYHKRKKDYDSAIVDYTKVIELGHSDPKIPYNNRGLAYYEKSVYDSAIVDFKNALRIDPNYTFAQMNFVKAYNARGFTYFNKKDYANAIENYQAALQMDSTNIEVKQNLVNAYNDCGLVYFNLKNYDNAIAYYQAALQIDSTNAKAKQNLADAQAKKQPIKQFISALKKLFVSHPRIFLSIVISLGLIFLIFGVIKMKAFFKKRKSFICPYCYAKHKKLVCDENKEKIPSEFLEMKNLSIALLGAKLSGKSNYIGVLINEIRKKMAGTFKCSLSITSDSKSKKAYDESYYSPLFQKGYTVMATDAKKEKIPPLIFPLKFMDKKHRTINKTVLTIYDTAGENLDDNDEMLKFNNYINVANGIILLIDPLQIPNIREKLTDNGFKGLPQKNTEIYEVISRIIDVIRKEKNITGQIQIPIALVFTKIDVLEQYDVLPRDSCLREESKHTKRGAFITQDFENTNIEMRDLIDNWLDDELMNYINQFKFHSFFGVSSLGQNPTMNKLDSSGIHPRRVLDPFLWLLSKEGYIRTLKR